MALPLGVTVTLLAVLASLPSTALSPTAAAAPAPDRTGGAQLYIVRIADPGASASLRKELPDEAAASALPLGLEASSPAAHRRRAAERAGRIRALLAVRQSQLARLDATLDALVAAGHVDHAEPLPGAGVILVTGDAAAAATLGAQPGVAEVRADGERWLPAQVRLGPARDGHLTAPALGWNLAEVGAERVWRPLGVTGEGVVIGTIDSGADWLHPALRARYLGRWGDHDHHWYDVTGPAASRTPVDPLGHGTAVLGLALGRAGPLTYGVAPGAEWLTVRAFDAQGRSTDSALLRAAAWLLAPTDLDGADPRPDLAPDIVNGSWALDNGADPLFSGILAAWRAAGILPVFAAGNVDDGRPGRVLAPAADPLALAVGASVPGGAPWPRSRSGPAYQTAIKPDLLAPGAGVMAPVPGGADAPVDGTSFAAPHVAGAAALVKAADPALTVADLEAFLRHYARDRGRPGPDPLHGWGDLDAGAAAEAALTAGRLVGRITDGTGRGAVASLQARSAAGGLPWLVTTDADGRYDLGLPLGTWLVSAHTSGAAAGPRRVTVEDDLATRLDLQLQPGPTGTVVGTATSLGGEPLRSGRVAAQGDAIAALQAGGRYTLTLPAGPQTLRFSAAGHRAVSETVQVAAGAITHRDVRLATAPRILVVDADSGTGQRVSPYLARALADLGFDADQLWLPAPGPGPSGACGEPTPPPDLACPPTADRLAVYGIVFWLHGNGSPGLLDERWGGRLVSRALEAYLVHGGRLVVAGQDIGLRDAAEGALDARRAPDFFRRVLGARWRADRAPAAVAQGLGPLAGLALDLRWPGGANTGASWAPEVVAPAAGAEGVAPVLLYPDGGAAALAASDAALGRRLYFAFGLQQAGDRGALARLVDAAVGWLEPPTLDLAAGPEPLAPGATARVTVTLGGGRDEAPVDLALRLPVGLSARALPPGMIDTGAGELRWTAHLGAGSRRELPVTVALDGPVGGGRPLRLGAAVLSWRRVVTATAALWPLAPELGEAGLDLAPARLAGAGAVTATLRLTNTGRAPARGATVAFRLPAAFVAALDRARASSGRLDRTGPAPRWQGDLAPGDRLTITVPGRLPGQPASYRFDAEVDDGSGRSSTAGALLLVGGADLSTSTVGPLAPVAAGGVVTWTITMANTGAQTALATARLALPPGVRLSGGPPPAPDGLTTLSWPEPLAPGEQRTVALPLKVAPDVARQDSPVELTLEDGGLPPRPVRLSARLAVRRADLTVSRALLLPPRPRAGETVTATLLVGNVGDAPAALAALVALPPALALQPGSVRASSGRPRIDPGSVQWELVAAARRDGYAWHSVAEAGVDNGAGLALVAGQPFELGLPIPFHTEVYTRAWATADGLLAFRPPADLEPPGQGPPPPETVAPLWRRRPTGAAAPRLRRTATAVTVTWPGPRGDGFAVTLAIDGTVTFAYGPLSEGAGAGVGLGAGLSGGAPVVLDSAEAVAMGGLTFDPPVAWRWLRFQADLAHGLGPNSLVRPGVWLRGAGSETILDMATRVNPVTLDRSSLTVSAPDSLAGGRLGYRLVLAADGVAEARGAEAHVDLPDVVELDEASLPPELAYDPSAGTLDWRGRLVPGAPRSFTWSARLAPELAPGARALARAVVQAPGVPTVARLAVTVVRATDFGGSAKRVSRAVARPGEVLSYTLRAANAGGSPRQVTLTDALPAGLSLLPATLTASAGPAPRWDAPSASLEWQGELPARSAVEVSFSARFAGGAATNVMRLEDGEGTSAAFWAEVVEVRQRLWLPVIWAGRP